MRAVVLTGLILAGCVALTGCPRKEMTSPVADVAGVAPLPQARILMREVDEQRAAGSTHLKNRDGTPLALLEPPFVLTADVASVALGMDSTGQPVLNLQMTEAAAPRILAATEARVGRRVAFTVGDRVLTVATIRGPFGKAMQVAGLEDATDAQRIFTEITGKAH